MTNRKMSHDEEIWKKIYYHGYPLEISTFGNVKRNGILLKKSLTPDGYEKIFVKSNKHKRGTTARVHRLVALAFIENNDPENKLEINHKDYNRANNNVNNLEWISHADNVRYSVCNKPDMRGSNNPNYGNRKLSKIYSENKELALEKQSRKGTKNGRCRKIRLYKDDVFIKEFDYIGLCCEYLKGIGVTNSKLDSIRGQINSCVRNNRKYKNHYSFEIL